VVLAEILIQEAVEETVVGLIDIEEMQGPDIAMVWTDAVVDLVVGETKFHPKATLEPAVV
jgi:hypothetical protein